MSVFIRSDINALRAVSVLGVVLFHFRIPYMLSGFCGVDIFFTVSGFLMTRIIIVKIEKGEFSIKSFLFDRATRIVPALLVMVGVLILLGAIYIEPETFRIICKHSFAAILFFPNFIFFKESGYFDTSSYMKFLLHTWSLSVEWQFYILYPVILSFVLRFLGGRDYLLKVLAALALGSLALSVAVAYSSAEDAASFGYFMLPTRAWEMIAGGLVAMTSHRLAFLDRRPRFYQFLGLVMVTASFFVFSPTTPWPSFWAAVPVAGAMLVIGANTETPFLNLRPIRYLGQISYSLYLWHWPVMVASTYFSFGFDWAQRILGLALSLILGVLSHELIEKPSRSWLRAPGKEMLNITRLAGAWIGLAAICWGGFASGGLKSRIGTSVAEFDDAVVARTDRIYPLNRCGTFFQKKLRPCEVGKSNSGRDVLVVGDSFAEMWYPRAVRIEHSLSDHAVVFVTYGGCPTLPTVRRVQPGYYCEQFYHKAMELAMSGRFTRVIFICQWAGYFTAGRPDIQIEEDGNGSTSSPRNDLVPKVVENFSADLKSLQSKGVQIAVVKTSPLPGYDEPLRLRRDLFNGLEPTERHFDWTSEKKHYLPIDDAFDNLQSLGVQIIDPARYICTNGLCSTIKGGHTIYSDSVHLRASAAVEMGAFLDPLFANQRNPS